MTALYVSNSASNEYSSGNNSNNGLSKSLPKLTIAGALAAASNGDVIYVNDGVYVESTNLDINKGVSIIPNTKLGVTIRGSAADFSIAGGVIRITTTSPVELHDLVFDAESKQYGTGINIQSGYVGTILVDGCRFVNVYNGRYGINIAKAASATISNCEMISASTANLAYLNIEANGYGEISNCLFDCTGGNGCGNYAIYLKANSGTGTTARICKNKLTYKPNATALCAIATTGIAAQIIEENAIETTGTTSTAAIYLLNDSRDYVAMAPLIRRNHIKVGNHGGYGIQVGEDASGSHNGKIQYPILYENEVVCSNVTALHGIILGWVVGGAAFKNKVVGCGLSMIAKGTTGITYFIDNDIINPSNGGTGAIRAKASAYLIVAGNRVSMNREDGLTNSIYYDEDNITHALSDGIVVANTIYSNVELAKAVNVGNASYASTAIFHLNNYVSNGFSSTAFSWQGTDYSTLSAWKAAHELSAWQNVTPIDTDRKFWMSAYEPLRDALIANFLPWIL